MTDEALFLSVDTDCNKKGTEERTLSPQTCPEHVNY